LLGNSRYAGPNSFSYNTTQVKRPHSLYHLRAHTHATHTHTHAHTGKYIYIHIVLLFGAFAWCPQPILGAFVCVYIMCAYIIHNIMYTHLCISTKVSYICMYYKHTRTHRPAVVIPRSPLRACINTHTHTHIRGRARMHLSF